MLFAEDFEFGFAFFFDAFDTAFDYGWGCCYFCNIKDFSCPCR
jgi:hypothetical protein